MDHTNEREESGEGKNSEDVLDEGGNGKSGEGAGSKRRDIGEAMDLNGAEGLQCDKSNDDIDTDWDSGDRPSDNFEGDDISNVNDCQSGGSKLPVIKMGVAKSMITVKICTRHWARKVMC